MLSHLLICLVVLCTAVTPALAQNWSFDARRVGMGSPGGDGNLARDMIDREKGYRSIVLPFGLLQIFSDFDRLDPTHDDFDLVRTIEYAASPLHYTFDRDTTGSGREFVTDVRKASLSRDLNRYRGFVPANQPTAQGLLSPRWGGTIPLHRGRSGSLQGLYIGAGPYVAMKTDLVVDPSLRSLLDSSTDVYLPQTRFDLGSASRGQLAAAITGGYRGRFPWSGASGHDGLYVAANVNYLRGFRYEDADVALRLDTDGQGLLTATPGGGSPLLATRHAATKGTGASVDLGVAAVVGPWEAGVGVTGVTNHLTWTDVERTTYALADLFDGDHDFIESDPMPVGRTRVTLPADVRGHLAFTLGSWTAEGEVGRGLQGPMLRAGLEQRWSAVAVRGGASYSREMWNPAVGIGLGLGRRLGLDVALYGNSANVERTRHAALAVSLRLNRI
jgi:hypothetical protein